MLNILLFSFIGVDVLLTQTTWPQVVAAILLIPVSLLARFVSVSLPLRLGLARGRYGPWTSRLLTWGGLRGGIAISLALGLPAQSEHRPAILTATYGIVLFTIAVQGLTVMPIIRRALEADSEAAHRPRTDRFESSVDNPPTGPRPV